MLCSFPWNKSIVAQPLFLEDLLPQRLVADYDVGRDIQSRLYVASIRTDVSLSGKIMISEDDEQLVAVAGDGAHDWCGILVLSFKGKACRAWLIKEIKVFVRDKELYRVVAHYFALCFYRDGIADGVEGDGKGNDDKRNDHRAGPHKSRRNLPDDMTHLLAP